MDVFRIFVKYSGASGFNMQALKVDIPVKRYLKKYLYALENLPYDTVIDITAGGHIPMVLGMIFTEKITTYFSDHDTEHLDDVITVLLNKSRVGRFQIMITSDRLRFFNSFLFKSFHDLLLIRILVAREFGQNESDVIKQFMHELDIIDDISFDALKKASYRLRKSRNMDLFKESNGTAA
jgi:hypothetical protein